MAQRARRSSFFAETEGDGEDNVQFDNIGRQELQEQQRCSAWSTDSPRKWPALLPPKVDHKFYTLSIEKNFAGKGLQIIVEIGLPNEHVVAATVVYFGAENMTESSGPLSFSVEADLDPAAHWWRTGLRSSPHEPLAPPAGIYGFESLREIYGEEDDCGAPALQEPGTVMMPDGRLFAFPTVMQHRTEEYRLLDPSRPGRGRFPRLYLVGPQYHICSTRNTPPQQHSWCADAGLSGFPREKYIMPPELVRCVEDMVGDFPTGEEEAIRQRYELREERREQRRTFDEEVQRYYFSD